MKSINLFSILLALGISTSSVSASPANNGITSSAMHKNIKEVWEKSSKKVADHSIEATILFTVTEEGTLHVVNVLSHDREIKECLFNELEGMNAAAGMTQGEVYAIDFSFLKL